MSILIRTHGEGHFLCPVCGKPSASGLLLHNHMRLHLAEEERADDALRDHMAKRIGMPASKTNVRYSSREYSCTEEGCGGGRIAKFGSAREFAQHMLNVHGKKPFACHLCGARYNR